ncbi:MAG: hypothetical protein MUC50_13405 [Myxococcota bacterium]|jgi:hypothetical protein|nr:hypothetical protein [Myxococcota bacterium]
MNVRSARRLACLLFLAVFAGCNNQPLPTPQDTVRDLLELHGLWGRAPQERSLAEREKAVEKERLFPLFTDLAQEDPFLAHLYLGFVVGALARHQQHLVYTAEGSTVEVRAGDVRISMHRGENRFRIALSESIPQIVRQRAEAEKERLVATPR